MVHGAEAVLAAEVRYKAPRVVAYSEQESSLALEDSVDLLDEAQEIAAERSTIYWQNLHNYHSRRLRPRSFVEGDLVLRLNQQGHLVVVVSWKMPWIG